MKKTDIFINIILTHKIRKLQKITENFMVYKNIFRAEFISRPNRFIANIKIDGKEEVAHVKNTGRCRELLTEGATVLCRKAIIPAAKQNTI